MKQNLGATVLCALAVFTISVPVVVSAQSDGDDDPTTQAITLFNQGQDAHEKGDLRRAIENYEKALKLLPEFPEAELQRGNAYQSLGKLSEAESAFRRAVELRDDWSLALASLGAILVRENRFAEAEPLLTKAIETDELNFPAYAAMTELRIRTRAPQPVLSLLLMKVRAITTKANPTASIWSARAALENATGDRKSSAASASNALALDAQNVLALTTAADVALVDNDPRTAEVFVKRLEALRPDSESTRVLRSRILLALDKNEEAHTVLASITSPTEETLALKRQLEGVGVTDVAELEKQLVIDPKNAVVLANLCRAYRTVEPSKALDFCRRASEAAPQSVPPVIGYAAALVQAQRYDEAIVLLRRLLTVAPNNSTARANLATALFQQKKYVEAKTEFAWLTSHQPDQPFGFYFLAIAHDQLGEYMDALANYQQFLRLADPESSKLEIEKVNLRLPAVQRLVKEGKGKKRE